MNAYRAIGYATALLGLGLIWTAGPGVGVQALVGVLAAVIGVVLLEITRDE
jgi:hypothetical protein